MVYKATSPEVAKRVLEARALAKVGASSVLIRQLTGFDPRFVRRLVKAAGGKLARKPRAPERWMRDRQRLIHVPCIVLFYESQDVRASLAGRLLRTYALYSAWIGEARSLDLDQCAQVIELYEQGCLLECQCTRCPYTFFALAQQSICPKCRLYLVESGGPVQQMCE